MHEPFGRAIDGARDMHLPGNRTGQHKVAACFAQFRQARLRGVEQRHDVQVDQLAPLVRIAVLGPRCVEACTRIGKSAVQPPEMLGRGSDGVLLRRKVGGVSGHNEARVTKFGVQFRELVFGPGHQPDIPACGHRSTRGGGSDATGRAGYEKCLAISHNSTPFRYGSHLIPFARYSTRLRPMPALAAVEFPNTTIDCGTGQGELLPVSWTAI